MPLFEIESWLGNTLALPWLPWCAICEEWKKKKVLARMKASAQESLELIGLCCAYFPEEQDWQMDVQVFFFVAFFRICATFKVPLSSVFTPWKYLWKHWHSYKHVLWVQQIWHLEHITHDDEKEKYLQTFKEQQCSLGHSIISSHSWKKQNKMRTS